MTCTAEKNSQILPSNIKKYSQVVPGLQRSTLRYFKALKKVLSGSKQCKEVLPDSAWVAKKYSQVLQGAEKKYSQVPSNVKKYSEFSGSKQYKEVLPSGSAWVAKKLAETRAAALPGYCAAEG